MAETHQSTSVDPSSGFCSKTRTFHSLRPPVPLPPLSQHLSVSDYTWSLFHSSNTSLSTPFLINADTGDTVSYSTFLHQTRSLASSLRALFPSLSKGQVAFIVSPPSLNVPVVYFSLLSLGIAVSPANPLSSQSELAHMAGLSNPVISFATSSVSHKLPSFPLGTVLIDSPQFQYMMTVASISDAFNCVRVHQSESAAILYSSGTTGRVKGVDLSHRNFIAVLAGLYQKRYEPNPEPPPHPVSLFTLPLFHVFGFFMLFRAFSMGETLVLMGRFDFKKMLMAVEKYRVTYMPVSPPLIVALAKSDLVTKYDLSSLRLLGCGGAPLGKEVVERFKARLPNVDIVQGYGMTETGGGATRMIRPDESKRHGSAGRLGENLEAKIVDPVTREALPPGQKGELWLRGPIVMKGYVGDSESTAETLDSLGWLRTGDLCYFDADGFLYVVDRLKELIKYKAYQVPPAELEHLLQAIPEIADAAVIPYPDEDAGEIPMAFIVRKPGSSITGAEVMDMIAKQVAPYKKIRRVAFIDAIPKSPAGKISRRELVNQATSGALARL